MENLSSSRSWQTPAEVRENLKEYFTFLYQANNDRKEFPVNLELVWPLAYQRKDHCVRELKKKFVQDVDYKFFPKNGENSKQGRPSECYYLSVSCMEWLIAREVREVFEVYRTVFHQFFEEVTGEKQETKVATYPLPKIPTEVTFVCDPQCAYYITEASAYTDFLDYFDMCFGREMCGCHFPIDLGEVYTLRYKTYEAATKYIGKMRNGSFLRYREGIDFVKIRPDGDRRTHYMMRPEMFYDIFCDYNNSLSAAYISRYGQRRVPSRLGRHYILPKKNTMERALLAGKISTMDAEQILCIRRFHEDCPNVDDPQLKDLPIYKEMVNDIVRWLYKKGKILDPEYLREAMGEEETKTTEANGANEAAGATGANEAAGATGQATTTLPAAVAAPAAPVAPESSASDAVQLHIRVSDTEAVLRLLEALASCNKRMVLDIDMSNK